MKNGVLSTLDIPQKEINLTYKGRRRLSYPYLLFIMAKITFGLTTL